jgi:hypothetical protein
MPELAQSPLSDAAPPFAPQNTPEKSDNPPLPSHPLPPPAAVAAHAARHEPVRSVDATGGWYAWTGEDLPRGDSGRGGDCGGALRDMREVTDDREIGDQAQAHRRDGTSQVPLVDSDHLSKLGNLRKL